MKRKFSTGLLSVILALLTVLSVPVTTIAAGAYEDTGAERLAEESLTSVTESADINYESEAETASEHRYAPCKSERCKALAEKAREEKELEESIIEVNVESLSENNGIDDNALTEVNSVTFSNNGASSGYLEGDALFEANVNKLLDGITGNNSLTEEQKALLIHNRLIKHCSYDYDLRASGYIGDYSALYDAITYGMAVCYGYSVAYCYLLNKVGIESYVCVSEELYHGWNIVKIDGEYFHVDVTWDDVCGYDYFLLSEKKMRESDHDASDIYLIDDSEILPPTGDKYDNYKWYSAYGIVDNIIYVYDTYYGCLKTYDGIVICDLGDEARQQEGVFGEDCLFFVRNNDIYINGKFVVGVESIFKYDFNTGEIKEIFTPPIEVSKNTYVEDLSYDNGRLYCSMFRHDIGFYEVVLDVDDVVLNTVRYNIGGDSYKFAIENIVNGESIKFPSVTGEKRIYFCDNDSNYLYTDEVQYISQTCSGWTTEKNGTEAEYTCGSLYTPTEDTDFYAVFPQTIEVKIDPYIPEREGFIFLGWAKDSSATTPTYFTNEKISITDKITRLYAVWADEDAKINTVTYNPKGGSVSPSKADVVDGYSTKLPTPTKSAQITYNANGGTNAPSAQNTSLTCNGWSTSSSATTAQYSCGATYKPTNNITLYAVWQKASLTLSSSVPTRTGYKFLGWSTDKNSTTADFASGGKVLVSGNATLYAVWKKIVYTINYYANGGNVNLSTEDVDVGASTKLPTPTKSVQITFDANGGTRTPDVQNCYLNCAGWATNSSSTIGEYACGSTYKPTGHVTLYAVWQKTTVNLISDKPMKEGYKFLGWSRDANATTATYKAGGKINISGNVTLYAVWGEYEEGDKVIEAVQTNDIALNYKSTAVISVEVTGTDNYTVEYESSNPRVVTVDEKGNIITKGTGKAEITVTAIDEFGNVAEDTCTVTVSYAWWQWIIVIVLFGWIWY